MTFAAVWCAVRVISETVASLPCILYRRQGEGKERATDDPRYSLVHDSVSDEMTAYTFFETGTHHLTLWGNSYSRIMRAMDGSVSLELRMPKNTQVDRPDPDSGLIYRNQELDETLTAEQVLHVRGLSTDGLVGMSVVGKAQQSIGEGMAAGTHGAAFYGNRARPDGVLKFPGQKLSKDAREAFRAQWKEQHAGAENDYNIAILHGGMEYESITMPHTDAQFLESRKFSVEEIARWFRIPPHMLYELTRSTNNNIEHQGLEFVMYSLAPWLRRWETTLKKSLIEPGEVLFFEFLVDSLLRGDQEGRSASYKAGREGGWLSVNEIRAKENMNPVDGGDEYLRPLNMAPAGQDSELLPRSLATEWQENMEKIISGIMQDNEQSLQSVREDQAEVKREIESLGKRITSAVVGDLSAILESHRRLSRLRNEVINAAKRVSHGGNFVQWLDAKFDDDDARKQELLDCAAGDADTFVDRVVDCVENWGNEK